MILHILILLLCLFPAAACILTLFASEKTVRLMPVLFWSEGVLSVILLILSVSYRKMLASVLLTAFFFLYLCYLLFHKEAVFRPGEKLLVFTRQKHGHLICELKEIYASPEEFPRQKALHAYRTPDGFILLRMPDTEEECFAYQFTDYHYTLEGIRQNCLILGTVDERKLRLPEYHKKRFFPCAEHALFAVLTVLIALPMLFLAGMRQTSARLETFLHQQAETGISAPAESGTELFSHEKNLILVIDRDGSDVHSVKFLSLDAAEAELDLITVNARLMRQTPEYLLFRDSLNTEDFGRIRTIVQDTFGAELNQILVMQSDQLLSGSLPEQTAALSLTEAQFAVLNTEIPFRKSGNYPLREADSLLKLLEAYLNSEFYDSDILSENEFAVMQNEYLLALLTSVQNPDSRPIRTTMTEQEIKMLYDSVIIAESRYRNCFRQKDHSIVLPASSVCTRLDDATLCLSDAALKSLMIQALYY